MKFTLVVRTSIRVVRSSIRVVRSSIRVVCAYVSCTWYVHKLDMVFTYVVCTQSIWEHIP